MNARTKTVCPALWSGGCGGDEPRQGCSWPVGQETLVYDFGRLAKDLPKNDVIDAIEQAILIWNDVLARLAIPLELARKQREQETVHVLISWEEHGPGISAAELPVAHADFPPACGVLSRSLPRLLHFEMDQDWTVDMVPGQLDITSVAVHEIGHILGLAHSSDPGSVMFSSLELGREPSPADERELRRLYRRHIAHGARLRSVSPIPCEHRRCGRFPAPPAACVRF